MPLVPHIALAVVVRVTATCVLSPAKTARMASYKAGGGGLVRDFGGFSHHFSYKKGGPVGTDVKLLQY